MSAAFPFWEVSSTSVTPRTLRHTVGPVTGLYSLLLHRTHL